MCGNLLRNIFKIFIRRKQPKIEYPFSDCSSSIWVGKIPPFPTCRHQVPAVPALHHHTPSTGHAATLPTSALSSTAAFQWNFLPQNKKGSREEGKKTNPVVEYLEKTFSKFKYWQECANVIYWFWLTCHTAHEIFKDTLHNELNKKDLKIKFITHLLLNLFLISC